MALPLERWARQATMLEPPRKFADPNDEAYYEKLALPRMADEFAAEDREGGAVSVDELLGAAMRDGFTKWRMMNGQLRVEKQPTALEGIYAGLVAYPPAQSLTAITGGTSNVAWWSSSIYSPLPANSVLAPEAYRICATGTVTSTAASQTITPSLNCGTAVGTGLGTGPAITLGSTITNALWYLMGDLTVRLPGSSGTIIGHMVLKVGTTAGASTTITHAMYGNTVQTVDFTTALGLTVGATPSASGVSVTPTQVHWMSWN